MYPCTRSKFHLFLFLLKHHHSAHRLHKDPDLSVESALRHKIPSFFSVLTVYTELHPDLHIPAAKKSDYPVTVNPSSYPLLFPVNELQNHYFVSLFCIDLHKNEYLAKQTSGFQPSNYTSISDCGLNYMPRWHFEHRQHMQLHSLSMFQH